MTAAILCPGPSLSNFAPGDVRADLILAVNRAALRMPCDWWCCTDYPAIRDNQEKIIGLPCLFSRRQTVMDLQHRLRPFPQVVTVEDLHCDVKDWSLLTTPAAIVFVESRGAKRIDLYGSDLNGTADFDGVEAGENRTDERWKNEGEILERLTEWLMQRGVELVRQEVRQ